MFNSMQNLLERKQSLKINGQWYLFLVFEIKTFFALYFYRDNVQMTLYIFVFGCHKTSLKISFFFVHFVDTAHRVI